VYYVAHQTQLLVYAEVLVQFIPLDRIVENVVEGIELLQKQKKKLYETVIRLGALDEM
jgi:hypothetical protein